MESISSYSIERRDTTDVRTEMSFPSPYTDSKYYISGVHLERLDGGFIYFRVSEKPTNQTFQSMDNLALYNEYDFPKVIISCYPMGERVHLTRSSSAAPSYYVIESDYFKVRTIDMCRELDYFYDWLHPMYQNLLSENTVEIPQTIVDNIICMNEKDKSIQEDADTNANEVNPGDESEETQKSADETDENEVYKDAETYESEADTIVGSDVEG
ncbi:26742_t:CDS:2 [Dentiscutata erythropus]|uniref:26742_t:CDS:1 n=1 Tax=Dentiscutata erythropus TaxID=1348616 RepID=A0A9N8VMB9_9GLOM|nr:26742_t:CDS:2 [Dentiscutata erythropus]